MSASVVVNANKSCIIIDGKNSNNNDTPLFPTSLLDDLDITGSGVKFDPVLSVSSPGEGLLVRSLSLEDYDRGFLELLASLKMPFAAAEKCKLIQNLSQRLHSLQIQKFI